MRLLERIDVLGDEAFQARLMRLSLAILAATLLAAAVVGIATGGDAGALATLAWWAALAAATLASLPVHELVHAAGFKLLCGPCKVSFGIQGPFLYTRTNDACATRARMVATLLGPSVVVTAALAAGALVAGAPTLAVLIAGVHLAGCVGDMLMAADALRAPACTHVRDTDVGIDLLSDKETP